LSDLLKSKLIISWELFRIIMAETTVMVDVSGAGDEKEKDYDPGLELENFEKMLKSLNFRNLLHF